MGDCPFWTCFVVTLCCLTWCVKRVSSVDRYLSAGLAVDLDCGGK